MASFFTERPGPLRILDPGAGIGTLSAAIIAEACHWSRPPDMIRVLAIEQDSALVSYLESTLEECSRLALEANIPVQFHVIQDDFISTACEIVSGRSLLQPQFGGINAVILNPPYRKIGQNAREQKSLRRARIETVNLYSAFVWLAVLLLERHGEIVAITPRSFCNGPYYRVFRKFLVQNIAIKHIHVFEARDEIFKRDEVLQENIIFSAVKGVNRETVVVSSSTGVQDDMITERIVRPTELVHPNDPESFIHIVPDDISQDLSQSVRALPSTLADLQISVSTGRVVDFRVRDLLLREISGEHAALIYPHNLRQGFVEWGNGTAKKAIGLVLSEITMPLLLPRGFYVLAKRFTAKEESKRIVAALLDPGRVPGQWYGIENHLDYFHRKGQGLDEFLAKGLTIYLNSTLVDEYFRQFSGHTQVNATDLRNLRYPTSEQLVMLGSEFAVDSMSQEQIDELVLRVINMRQSLALRAKQKIDEARQILQELGVPKELQNQRSALTLLALSALKPNQTWEQADAPLLRIHELMLHFAQHFGVTYAENTRETVRRYTIHQFEQLGLVIKNPDDPGRAVNSPSTRYQLHPALLKLIRTFGTADWDRNLRSFIASTNRLTRLRARERQLPFVPVSFPDGKIVTLSSGGQNMLVKEIVEQFCPRFTPGGTIYYLGDAGNKSRVFAYDELREIGVSLDRHGKLPDVVIFFPSKGWLVLIEAVTSHGPISIKRHNELKELFAQSKAPLVFVTAFPTRRQMVRYLAEIAWETEVWIAESPEHLIHFNGERFLGPYE